MGDFFLDHHLSKFPPGLLRPFLDARNADFKDAGMYVCIIIVIIIVIIIIIIITMLWFFSFSSSFISVMDIFGVEEVCWRKAAFTNVCCVQPKTAVEKKTAATLTLRRR